MYFHTSNTSRGIPCVMIANANVYPSLDTAKIAANSTSVRSAVFAKLNAVGFVKPRNQKAMTTIAI